MANKYVTANNKLVVVDGKLLQISGDSVDDELLNLIDTQTTSLGTTELSVSELDTLIDNHIVDGVTLDSSVLLIDSPSNNEVSIKDIRVSNIDVAFITLNTTNGYVDLYGSGNNVNLYADTTLNYESGNITTDNLVAENIKKDVEILGVIGTHEGGGSLNVAYGTTPPADTSKIWLQCEEPQAVEVQNYLGECAVSDVANWGAISNPVAGHSAFKWGYYTCCYIENNKIAIVGYNHIRIYDVSTKSYVEDYTISVGTNAGYTNVLFKNNVLYFAYEKIIYSYDLSTQSLTTLYTSDYRIYYMFFNSDTEIDCLCYSSGNYHYRYNISNGKYTLIAQPSKSYGMFQYLGNLYGCSTIKVNNYVYSFYLYNGYQHYMKYNVNSNTIEKFTSYINFLSSIGYSSLEFSRAVYDGERYIYLIGGRRYITSSTYDYNNFIKYDTLYDTFEMLDKKLIKGKFVCLGLLIDNRVYIFGGEESGTDYGRPNQIDYFDLSYPLTQNNCIITTNTINADNSLPLINTEKLKLNSNIASAYIGNADNLAEKVNAYYWNGSKWVGINCDGYTNEVVE